jgi:hypothetical protein
VDLPAVLDPEDDADDGWAYGTGMQVLFVRLVLAGTSLRGAARVLALLAEVLGWCVPTPHWTTGRLWLLRLGHAMLTRTQVKAEDWAWLIDHTVQIGQTKCLAIVGLRLVDLPPPGQCLTHHDLQLIALVPGVSWTKEDVAEQLQAASRRTGVPRVIVNDHGGDVHGGVQCFQERHAQTVEIYDAKHKAACLLKSRLEQDPRWQEFQHCLGQTRCAIQQTELAFLAPPGPKPKARFMNLATALHWADHVIAILRQPPAVIEDWVTTPRLYEKLGWLEAFADDVALWSEWQAVVDSVLGFVNQQGIYRGAAQSLRAELPPGLCASSRSLAQELVGFVAQQARQTRPGERLPGSTEVLESCFGRFKHLEKQQARGGFTSLLLGFGALLAKTTTEAVKQALTQSTTRKVVAWCKEHLGTTVFGQRKLAYAGAQQNWDES